MIQVRIGTVEWRACPDGVPDSGWVLFAGDFLYSADGLTPLMVWDAGLNNVRGITDDDTRDARRRLAIAAVDAEWTRRKDAGFHYLGNLIDSDPISRENIQTTASEALACKVLGQPFALGPGWKCADNTYLPLDADGVLGMRSAMWAAGLALFAHAQELKAQIAAATDPASVDVTAGWPEV